MRKPSHERRHLSFAAYRDPARDQWGRLRVWNDDTIAAGAGLPMHPHMEIITYVREGALSHRDSLGNAGVTAAGDVQVMSAGTGISHTEYNAGETPTTLFQIWLFPDRAGHAPRWGTRPFPKTDRSGRFVALASGQESDAEALPLRAPARILGATLTAGGTLDHDLTRISQAYLVIAKGVVTVNGVDLEPRDGLAIAEEACLQIQASADAELVLVEMWG